MSTKNLDGHGEYDLELEPEGRGGPSTSLILFGLLAVLTAVLILQNGADVEANFLWMHPRIKLWLAIVISVAVGVVLDRLVLSWWRRSRKRRRD